MYTTTQFAKLIGVDPMTLRRWDKNGTLKPIHIGTNHHRRYTDEHLRQVRNMNINASYQEMYFDVKLGRLIRK